MHSPVVAIDGPAGVGKSTVACQLAQRTGFHILVSGALYRIVGMLLARERIAADDARAVASRLAALEVRFALRDDTFDVYCDHQRVTDTLGDEACAEAASHAGESPAVRAALLEMQHRHRRPPGLVADGRDMGTVVFPDAQVKVFLTAGAEVRAERRYKQLKRQGIDVTMRVLVSELTERDERDANRKIAPLKPAPDAVLLDTTDRTVAETVEAICALTTKLH